MQGLVLEPNNWKGLGKTNMGVKTTEPGRERWLLEAVPTVGMTL